MAPLVVTESVMHSVEQGGVGVSPAEADNELDLQALGRALWRKKWLILLPTLLVAIATLVIVNQITPRYKSEAKIAVEGRENVFLRPEAEKSIDRAVADQEAIATQVQILQSRDIARQVIRELKLGERPEFDPVLKGISPISTVLALIGFGRDRLSMTPEERVMEIYYDRLTVSAVERSRVITIEFMSEDPELAAKVVNAIVDAYMKMQQQAKVDQTRSASAYLANEITQLRKTVQEADAKVDEFRAKANLFIGNNETNLNTQQLGELTTQLATARAQKADLDARSKAIRDMLKNGKSVESSDIANSDLLKRLIEQRVLLRAQLAEQSSTLLGRHPRIQELNAQINALDTQIRGELERLVLAIENDARIAGSRVEQTTEAINRIKSQISSSVPQDVQLRALEREAKAQRDLLESYLARYREATARENIDAEPAEARVISRATVSNVPAFPKTVPIVIVATLATLFLMMAFVLSSEILRQGVPTRARQRPVAPGGSDAPLSPAMPAPAPSKTRRSLFGLFRRKRGAADESKDARPQIEVPVRAAPKADRVETLANALTAMGEPGRRIVLFGAGRNVGTTYTALSLARALSAKGTRVVLADLALQAPNLSVTSVEPQAPGFAELARGTASFGDVITRDKFSRVHLVSTGMVDGDAAAIFASPRLTITLEALARAYDHLVIDGGAVDEAPIRFFAGFAPRAVLVAKDLAAAATLDARAKLTAAGFAEVVSIQSGDERRDSDPVAA
ncbi:MAG TPA: exopolysaccharide transport family protein [Pseudorhodoplanes sp.]|nr:exopolysaccharide transport family protein [Pseudorhodoplanes sp.]